MLDNPYTILIGQLFKSFYTENWIKQNIESPVILASRQFPIIYPFVLEGDKPFGIQFGSSATSYVVPKLSASISGQSTVSHQYMTDTVRGNPKVRRYDVRADLGFLGKMGEYIKEFLGKMNSTLQFNIVDSLDFIRTLESRTAAGKTTLSDTYMLFSADGTFFEEAILEGAIFNVSFSNGVSTMAEGRLTIQEITSYDIQSIFTTQGTIGSSSV